MLVNDGMLLGALFTSRLLFVFSLFFLVVFCFFVFFLSLPFPDRDGYQMVVLGSVKAAAEDAEQGKSEERDRKRMRGKET